MKKFLYLIFLFISGCASNTSIEPEKTFNTIYEKDYGDSKFILQERLDRGDIRKNPDGTLFFRTDYKVILITNSHKYENILDGSIYTQHNTQNSMSPAVIMSGDGKKLTIFAFGKDENQNNYGMSGYSYYLDDSLKWKKEIVFEHSNIGWFSYFGGIDGDKLTLWNFSFAGYYIVRSERASDGTWNNVFIRELSPDEFIRDSGTKEKILITSQYNAQMPSFDLEGEKSYHDYRNINNESLSDQQITSAIKYFIAFSLYINDPDKFEKSAIDCTLQDITSQFIDNPNASAFAAEIVHSTLSDQKFSSQSAAIGAIKNNLTNQLRNKGYSGLANGLEIADFTKCIVNQ